MDWRGRWRGSQGCEGKSLALAELRVKEVDKFTMIGLDSEVSRG